MADELRDIIESVRARVQAELEAQLTALKERHQQALVEGRRHAEAEGRRAAEAEAEQAWSAKVQAARAEAERRAQEAIASVRVEYERERAAEANRLKAEAEQRAIEAATRVRTEMEKALAAERAQANVRLEAEQRRLSEEQQRRVADELDKARKAFDAMRTADRVANDAARAALEAELATRGASGVSADRLVGALHEIDAADSVSATLAAIVHAAAQEAPRATLFVASGEQLREWETPGAASITHAPLYVRDTSIGLVGEAVRRRELVRSADAPVPAFAGLAPGRTAVAAPLVLDGQPVGVLYGDDGAGPSDGTQWVDAFDVIARHGSARLGYITALRTAQAMRFVGGLPAGSATAAMPLSSEEDEQAARRYARLVVSELKLYNEAAVSAGREHRDLSRRLAGEIDRARRMFEERVPPSVQNRAQLFHHELVQTLAGGDPSLLG